MEEETDGMKGETDGMEGETDGREGETDGERLTIIGVAYVMETTSAILNTSSFNGTIALRRSLWGDSGLKWICRSSYLLHLGSKSIQTCVCSKGVGR